MKPPFDDSPTVPMLPPRDDRASQEPQPYPYPPQYPQQYPPAWPAPQQPQTPYPYQMVPYAPRVQQSVARQQTGPAGHQGRHPTHRMPRIQALALAGRLKRWTIALAVAAFVAFVGLAAGHVTGVTAAASSSSNNATQQNNGDDNGGFFGGQQNNGSNGGFFGSGGSGSPSSGTSVS